MPTQQTPTRFPLKTALSIATVALGLALWHEFANRPPGLDWRGVDGVFSLAILREPWRNGPPATASAARGTPDPYVQGSGLSTHDSSSAPPAPSGQARQTPDALLIDSGGSLDPFYAALARLDRHGSRGAKATVVHFGDSPTTADLITGDVRQELQRRFGDAGQGFNLIAKPWAWYQHRNIDETDRGWKFTTAVGTMREGPYGIGGAYFDGDTGAMTRYKLSGAGPSAVDVPWASRPDGGSLVVAADDRDLAIIDTSKSLAGEGTATEGTAAVPVLEFETIPIPPQVKTVELRVTEGNVRLYGVLFERDQPGVVYDSIGLNGASVTVLSRALGPAMMKRSFAHLHPDVVIINYGTNEAGFASYIDKQYEGELRHAIARVREAAPGASILLMSPMDRGERVDGNAIQTMATIPKIVAMQQRVAADSGCAFFNSFAAMGGEGTMQRWYEGRPRLVGGDLIHPTPQGAKIVADAFVDQLEQGYARFQMRVQAGQRAPGQRKPEGGPEQ